MKSSVENRREVQCRHADLQIQDPARKESWCRMHLGYIMTQWVTCCKVEGSQSWRSCVFDIKFLYLVTDYFETMFSWVIVVKLSIYPQNCSIPLNWVGNWLVFMSNFLLYLAPSWDSFGSALTHLYTTFSTNHTIRDWPQVLHWKTPGPHQADHSPVW